ncbi:MAG: alpha/beta hydrolase, partial [Verrucomicrobiota bacterium]
MRHAVFTFVCLITIQSFTSAQEEVVALWPDLKMPHSLGEETASEVTGLTVYQPTEKSSNGASVVICPGGGYGGLARDHEGHQIGRWFQERGVAAYVLTYRLGSGGYHYPAQLADVQRALRVARGRAGAHGRDPDRVAVMGFSAGGHLASMAATLFDRDVYEPLDSFDQESARPDLAILCYPVISLEKSITHGGSRRNLLGPEKVDDDDLAASLSSDRNVSATTPPTFLFQTNEDSAVPAENATRFFLACRKHGVPVEYHCYEKGPHGVGLYRGDPVLGTWSGLLDNWLRSQMFFTAAKGRAAVSGTVSLDGIP